jgi:U3 small nucleolar RNA-associated protein 20
MLRRFMSSQWSSHERTLCLIVPKLASIGVPQFSAEGGKSLDLVGPQSPISVGASQAFTSLTFALGRDQMEWDQTEQLAIMGWRYIDVLSAQLPASDSAHVETVYTQLVSLLRVASRHLHEPRLAPLCGKALYLIGNFKPANLDGISSTQLSQLIIAFGHNSTFLNGALQYIKLVRADIFNDQDAVLVSDSLISRLISPSGDVRRLSLYILELFPKSRTQRTSNIIKAATMVEEVPLNITNQRNVAMYVRKLGIDYQHAEVESWEYRIVPHYCFGTSLLHGFIVTLLTLYRRFNDCQICTALGRGYKSTCTGSRAQ